MADTPQQRTDESSEDLGTTPDAPQGRNDPPSEDPPDRDEEAPDLQSPVTGEEVDRRQLGDEVDTED